MLIKNISSRVYRGGPVGEVALEPGKIYNLPDAVGEALLAQRPDWFEKVTVTEALLKLAIPIRVPVPEEELPEAVAEAAGDEEALLKFLRSRQRRERRRLAALEKELGEARSEWERLAGMKVSGEATRKDLDKLERARQRVRDLEAGVEEAKAGLTSLEERIAEVEVEIAKKRLEVHVQEFDQLIERYKAGFASLCQSAIGLVDQADSLFAIAHKLDALCGRLQAEAAKAGAAVEQRYLEGMALPRPSELKVDRLLRPRVKDRKRAVRELVAKFGG